MYNYEMRIIPKTNAEGKVYFTAFYPEIKAVIGGGYTKEEAIKDAEENLEFYLEFLKEEKREIPLEYEENNYSGKIALRVSRSNHKKLIEKAEDEGISVNMLINNAIENYFGNKNYSEAIMAQINTLQSLTIEGNKYNKANYVISSNIYTSFNNKVQFKTIDWN